MGAALASGARSGTGGAAGSPASIRLKRVQKLPCAEAMPVAGGAVAWCAGLGAEVEGSSGATAGASCGGFRSSVPGSAISGVLGMR